MEKGVWIVLADYTTEKVIQLVCEHEYDADLFIQGAKAAYGSPMKKEYYPIYQHGPQPEQLSTQQEAK